MLLRFVMVRVVSARNTRYSGLVARLVKPTVLLTTWRRSMRSIMPASVLALWAARGMLGERRARRMDVVHANAVPRRLPQLRGLVLGRDLDLARCGQRAFVHHQVIAVGDGLEVT